MHQKQNVERATCCFTCCVHAVLEFKKDVGSPSWLRAAKHRWIPLWYFSGHDQICLLAHTVTHSQWWTARIFPDVTGTKCFSLAKEVFLL